MSGLLKGVHISGVWHYCTCAYISMEGGSAVEVPDMFTLRKALVREC